MCSAHIEKQKKKKELLLTIFMIRRTTTVLLLMCFMLITSRAEKPSVISECLYCSFSYQVKTKQCCVSVHCVVVDLIN